MKLKEQHPASCTYHICNAGGTRWVLHSEPRSSVSCRTSPPSRPSSSLPHAACRITASTQRYVWASLPEVTALHLSHPPTRARGFCVKLPVRFFLLVRLAPLDWHDNVDQTFLKVIIIIDSWPWLVLFVLLFYYRCRICFVSSMGRCSTSHFPPKRRGTSSLRILFWTKLPKLLLLKEKRVWVNQKRCLKVNRFI